MICKISHTEVMKRVRIVRRAASSYPWHSFKVMICKISHIKIAKRMGPIRRATRSRARNMAKTMRVAVTTTVAVSIVPVTVIVMTRPFSVSVIKSEVASRLFVNPFFENPGHRMISLCRGMSRRIVRHFGSLIDVKLEVEIQCKGVMNSV